MPQEQVVIIGAVPAGLTAAYILAARYGITSTILEADDIVGGISRTVERDGWRFDIGGHRFFTKVKEVEALWHEILPDEDFMLRPRMSRIYYNGKYYDYPLKASNALGNLGIIESPRCVLSYIWARINPPKDQSTLEGWIVARFGWRLYNHFFKTYNEKLWGVPVNKLPSDFAAQRIKNLSLSNAVLNALLPKRNQKNITSLIEEFQYPKFGPGMMWERCRDLVVKMGCKIEMNTRVAGIKHANGRATSVIARTKDGKELTIVLPYGLDMNVTQDDLSFFQIIQQEEKRVGFNLVLQSVPPATFFSSGAGWPGIKDKFNVLPWYWVGRTPDAMHVVWAPTIQGQPNVNNVTGYQTPQLASLITDLDSTSSATLRQKYSYEIQNLVVKNALALGISPLEVNLAVTPKLHDVWLRDDVGEPVFSDAYFSK